MLSQEIIFPDKKNTHPTFDGCVFVGVYGKIWKYAGILSEVPGGETEADDESAKEQSGQSVLHKKLQVSWLLPGKEWTRNLYPGSQKFPTESKTEAERVDQQEPRQKCAHGNGEGEGVHPRMDWVLLHR